MKSFLSIYSFLFLFGTLTANAQQDKDLQNRNPIYDYAENKITQLDTVPDYESKTNKLKITGTIYKSDGVTPAKDVLLYIEQPDEYGDFDLRKKNDKRYVHHRAWVKTDADGKYTIYTFVPGSDRRYNQPQQIFPMIKEASQPEYALDTFLFDEDPLLTRACRKKIAKNGDTSRILTLKKQDGLFVTTKNIVLSDADKLASK